ncbi:MAG: riboflavin biosynthesis protein RibD, partial [Bacteroidetes bacterium]
PCANLIIERGLRRVVVGCEDPNPRVSGRGIALMRAAGIQVDLAPDPAPFRALNRAFFVNQQQNRTYVTLKWAETRDGYMARYSAQGQPEPLAITGPEANAFTHSLRAGHQAIAVGRRTAAIDNPRLNTRLFPGDSPLRVVFDRDLRLPRGLHLLQDGRPTLILNRRRSGEEGPIRYYQPQQWRDLRRLMVELYREQGLCSLMVEGGPFLLQGFLDQGVYDEIHLLRGPQTLGGGLPGPHLPQALQLAMKERLGADAHLVWEGK